MTDLMREALADCAWAAGRLDDDGAKRVLKAVEVLRDGIEARDAAIEGALAEATEMLQELGGKA